MLYGGAACNDALHIGDENVAQAALAAAVATDKLQ
jgi:hypothetical protein